MELEAKVYPRESSPKLFKNKLLERLSKSHIVTINILYILVATFLTSVYWYHLELSIIRMVTIFFSGILVWTLAEYLMHRFLYHDMKDANYNNGFQYLFHGIHHEYPNDPDRIVLPPVPSLLLASVFFGFYYLIMGNEAFAFAPGFLIGYLIYINIHWMVHKYPPSKKYSFWWTHHNIHHFQQHDRAFGVTTSLWDRVFQTMPEPNRKTIKIEVIKNKNN